MFPSVCPAPEKCLRLDKHWVDEWLGSQRTTHCDLKQLPQEHFQQDFSRLVSSCPGRAGRVDNDLFLLPVPNVDVLWTLIQLESWLGDGQGLCSD